MAGNDAPRRFAEGASVLGQNLTNLNTTFNGLSDNRDNTALQYAAPVGRIVGIIGELYLENMRNDALKKAVNNGSPEIRKMLDLLENDINDGLALIKKTGISQIIAEQVNDYNRNRSTINFDDRNKLIKKINDSVALRSRILKSNPVGLIQTLRESNESLVSLVNSSKKPENLAQFNSSLELFRNRITEVAAAIQEIREIRNRS